MNLSEYSNFDGIGLANLVKNKQVTPEELLDTALEGVSKVNPAINAIVQTLADEAKKEINAGIEGPFQGVPFLLKELPAHAVGINVSLGSHFSKNIVAPHDSNLMKRFRKAGFITIGTTTTPEFGISSTTESNLHGLTRNPWDLERITGGSSGGSSAAVASGIVPIAHGNDGAGSIRTPASCCGLVGLKPTRGRTPTGPDNGEFLFGLAIELGVTRSVRDTAALLDAVSGPDIGCYAWAEPPSNSYFEDVSTPPKRLKIALMTEPMNGAPVDQEILDALHKTAKICKDLGHEIVEAKPDIDEHRHFHALNTFFASQVHHDVSGIAKTLNRTPTDENLEPATWSAYQYGQKLKASDIREAIDIQNVVSRKVGKFFTEYDVLLTPTLAQLPLKFGEISSNIPESNFEDHFKRTFTFSPFVYLFNTTGQPAITLPLEWSKENLPIGMQFVGRFADETTLIRLAAQLEKANPWKDKHPNIHV